jgi:hypothetical protein
MAAFVHTLWFQCRRCGSAISTAITSYHSNVEAVDGRKLPLRCECGWAANVFGYMAARHFTKIAEESSGKPPRAGQIRIEVYEAPSSNGLHRVMTF